MSRLLGARHKNWWETGVIFTCHICQQLYPVLSLSLSLSLSRWCRCTPRYGTALRHESQMYKTVWVYQFSFKTRKFYCKLLMDRTISVFNTRTSICNFVNISYMFILEIQRTKDNSIIPSFPEVQIILFGRFLTRSVAFLALGSSEKCEINTFSYRH